VSGGNGSSSIPYLPSLLDYPPQDDGVRSANEEKKGCANSWAYKGGEALMS
jgi:hypothetical protein